MAADCRAFIQMSARLASHVAKNLGGDCVQGFAPRSDVASCWAKHRKTTGAERVLQSVFRKLLPDYLVWVAGLESRICF